MKGFIQLTAIESGLPVVIRTDCIEHIRQLPAGGDCPARTIVYTGNDRCDKVTETAEEIQQKIDADMHEEATDFLVIRGPNGTKVAIRRSKIEAVDNILLPPQMPKPASPLHWLRRGSTTEAVNNLEKASVSEEVRIGVGDGRCVTVIATFEEIMRRLA
jgi:hypothetical protein